MAQGLPTIRHSMTPKLQYATVHDPQRESLVDSPRGSAPRAETLPAEDPVPKTKRLSVTPTKELAARRRRSLGAGDAPVNEGRYMTLPAPVPGPTRSKSLGTTGGAESGNEAPESGPGVKRAEEQEEISDNETDSTVQGEDHPPVARGAGLAPSASLPSALQKFNLAALAVHMSPSVGDLWARRFFTAGTLGASASANSLAGFQHDAAAPDPKQNLQDKFEPIVVVPTQEIELQAPNMTTSGDHTDESLNSLEKTSALNDSSSDHEGNAKLYELIQAQSIQIDGLRSSVSSLRDETKPLAGLEASLATVQTALGEFHASLASTKSQLKKQGEEIKRADGEVQSRIGSVEKKQEETSLAITSLNERLAASTAEISAAQGQVDALKASNASATEKTELSLRISIKSLSDEVDVVKKALEALKTGQESSRGGDQQIQALQAQIDAKLAEVELKVAQETRKGGEEQLQALRTQVEAIEASQKTAQKSAHAEDQLQALRAQLEEKITEATASYERKLEETNKSYTTAVSTSERRIEELTTSQAKDSESLQKIVEATTAYERKLEELTKSQAKDSATLQTGLAAISAHSSAPHVSSADVQKAVEASEERWEATTKTKLDLALKDLNSSIDTKLQTLVSSATTTSGETDATKLALDAMVRSVQADCREAVAQAKKATEDAVTSDKLRQSDIATLSDRMKEEWRQALESVAQAKQSALDALEKEKLTTAELRKHIDEALSRIPTEQRQQPKPRESQRTLGMSAAILILLVLVLATTGLLLWVEYESIRVISM